MRVAIRRPMDPSLTADDEPKTLATIRVWPKNEDMRKYLYYPGKVKIKFRATLDDGVDWPFDSFTKRRLAKGDVFDKSPAERALAAGQAMAPGQPQQPDPNPPPPPSPPEPPERQHPEPAKPAHEPVKPMTTEDNPLVGH